MKWPTADEMRALVPLPEGYRLEQFQLGHVADLIAGIKAWYPEISVGVNSGYLREDYYLNRVYLEGKNDRDIIVFPVTFKGKLVGMWTVEREIDSLAIYGRFLVIAPEHRGANLAGIMMKGADALGQSMGAAFLYALATLRIPQAQRVLESTGYRLLGFFPGYDREEISPGVVKRVYQAVYAKLLVPESEILRPNPKNMTPASSALFAMLFADPPVANT
jgi:GNAT superfamily N-acetyltransferase